MNKLYREFPLGGINGIFNIETPKKKFNANTLTFGGIYPYVIRSNVNNGIKGYITQETKYLNQGNTISFGQDTATMFYQKKPYFTGDKIKIFSLKERELNEKLGLYFITAMRMAFSTFSWGSSSFDEKVLKKVRISLPITTNDSVDFNYMEECISELVEERISELEKERISELEGYLKVTGFNDYILTTEEKKAIEKFKNGEVHWKDYNVENLFGKSTRGKRLKSMDRISGNLPFVTAGEANEGISAYIGNNVDIFSKNTSTIDMFGSAKYRNYDYGADDHVAVVHTEKLSKYAVMFVTSALNKSAYAGQFDYSRNFYAKDADELSISLPTKNMQPDFDFMETYIKATQKLVIRDVVNCKDEIISKTKYVVNNNKFKIEEMEKMLQ